MDEIETNSKPPQMIQIIPPGVYRAKLIEVKNATSKNNRPMKELTWELMESDYAGRTVKAHVVTDTETSRKVLSVIIYNMRFEPADYQIDDLCGNECYIQIEKRNTSNYGTINTVSYYFQIDREDQD